MPDLWPFWPHRESTERLSWFTDVMRSAEAENRLSLRDHRQMLDYAFTLPDGDAARAEEMFLSQPKADWFVPVWAERSRAPNIGSSDTVIACDTNADYRVGSEALIAASCESYVIAEISAVNEGSIEITAPVGADLGNCWIVPLRTAYVVSGIRGNKIAERGWSEFDMSFAVRDNVDNPASPYAQYDGLDLVRKCGTIQPLNFLMAPSVEYVDSGLGPVVIEDVRDVPEKTYNITWVTTTPADRWTRKRWFQSIRGQDQPFWLVDWQKDMVAPGLIPMSATTVDIVPVLPDVGDYAGRTITFDDGALVVREIASASVAGNYHRLVVSALPRDLTGSKIRFLRKVRLATDLIEIAHVHGFTASCSFNVTEVPT